MGCLTAGFAALAAPGLTRAAGSYSCLTCRFFDDDLGKQPYHCEQARQAAQAVQAASLRWAAGPAAAGWWPGAATGCCRRGLTLAAAALPPPLQCGICRIGGRSNYFHCDTCGSCYSIALQARYRWLLPPLLLPLLPHAVAGSCAAPPAAAAGPAAGPCFLSCCCRWLKDAALLAAPCTRACHLTPAVRAAPTAALQGNHQCVERAMHQNCPIWCGCCWKM